MVNFKEISKEIFDICTNITKSEGRATEKIEEMLKDVYDLGRINMLSNRDSKKAILMLLLQQSGIPLYEFDTTKLKHKKVNLEEIADFLIDNGIELTNPFAKYYKYLYIKKRYK